MNSDAPARKSHDYRYTFKTGDRGPLMVDDIELFSALLELPTPAERDRYLDEACGDDTLLRTRMQTLLESYDEADQFLEQSPSAAFSAAPSVLGALRCETGDEIGPYKLGEILGEGGMGVVYEATQERPIHRTVAIKIVKHEALSRDILRRFEFEWQTLSVLDHPHIAKVLDAGTTANGWPFFVMELVRGTPITEFCRQRQLTIEQRLQLFKQVCSSVQHAHEKGIIHRDIKPSNILVTVHDQQPVAKVIDFGIAKATQQQHTAQQIYTTFVQMIGTPLYMSPEQAAMDHAPVDIRTDIYSLGTVLYELLTDNHPFDAQLLREAGFDEARRMIRENDPAAPSQKVSSLGTGANFSLAGSQARRLGYREWAAALRGELDWIILKTLEKDRYRRYESAAALSADIDRYLKDEPVLARPATWWMRQAKWRRRHPVTSAVVAVGVAAIACLMIGAMWHNHRLSQALAVADKLNSEMAKREESLHRELYFNDIQRAWSLVHSGDTTAARQVLGRHANVLGKSNTSNFEWAYVWNVASGPQQVLTRHEQDVLSADLSANGELLASGDRGGEIKIWDVVNGKELKSLNHGGQEVTSVRFSSDGSLLATAGKDRTIRVWDVATWEAREPFAGHDATITSIAWSPDGQRIASSGRDSHVYIWNVSSSSIETKLPEHTDVVRSLAWSPDGQWLATADMNRGAELWKVSNWQHEATFSYLHDDGTPAGILTFAFSADSRELAFGGYGNCVCVADIAKRSLETRLTTGSGVWSLAFFSENLLAVGCGSDCMVARLKRAGTAAAWVREGIGETGNVRAVIPTRDGRSLICASQGAHSLNVWDLETVLGYKQVRTGEYLHAIAPSADLVGTVSGETEQLKIRSATDPTAISELDLERQYGCLAVFSGNGQWLATPLSRKDQAIGIWRTKDWESHQQLTTRGVAVTKLALSYDGKWLAGTSHRCVIGIWNVSSGDWRELLPAQAETGEYPWHSALAFSPTENLFAAARRNDTEITLWRTDGEQPSFRLAAGPGVIRIAFSPDGETLAAATDDLITLFAVDTGEKLGVLPGHKNNGTLVFAPNGRVLASAGFDERLRLWDAVTQQELLTIHLPSKPKLDLMEFRSERQLVIACEPDRLLYLDVSTPAASASP